MSAFASFTYAPDPPPPDEAEHLKNHDLEAECIIDYFNSLLEKLRQHDPTLIEIDFTEAAISINDEDVKELVDALEESKNTTCRSLVLSADTSFASGCENFITDKSAKHIQRLLQLNTLESLSVQGGFFKNNFGEIINAMNDTSRLTKFSLTDIALRSSAIDSFVTFIKNTTTLKELELDLTMLTVQSTCDFLDAVACNNSLQSFVIHGNDSHKVIDHIADAVKHCTTLTRLDVTYRHDLSEHVFRTINDVMAENVRLVDFGRRFNVSACGPEKARLLGYLERNRAMTWHQQRRTVLHICLAFMPWCDWLPAYVLLHIIDQLPYYHAHLPHNRKIQLILNVYGSARRVRKVRRLETLLKQLQPSP